MEDLTILRLSLAVILVAAMGTSCNAASPKVESIKSYALTAKYEYVPGVGRLPFAPIAVLHQTKDETKEQFVVRVGRELLNFSTITNYEGCGGLAIKAADLHSVSLFTNLSHKGCVILSTNVMSDYKATAAHIHSHPVKGSVVFNRIDELFVRGKIEAGRVVDIKVEDFSENDYSIGPGWVVADGKLMWQNGKGTEKIIHTYTQE